MNKLARIRRLYGDGCIHMTKTEAGQKLLGIANPKAAYDTWSRMERSGTMTKAVEAHFDLLIYIKEKGCQHANDVIAKFINRGVV